MPQDQVEGQFFNCTLTSAFQPIWLVGDEQPAAYEAGARNVSDEDAGLSLWRLLDNAASGPPVSNCCETTSSL